MYVPAHTTFSQQPFDLSLWLMPLLCVCLCEHAAPLSETQNWQKSQKEKLNRAKARSYKSNLPGMLADH
jgi:hypothetical protein